ncbi:twin-arginine translocase TatA/TatE family subunit [Agreia sp. COWG]|uniref:twin-arginine translocase TatA/TatE family subunit n=1 Tax=Agreia sp. COWG TaxID=2773266 RepID=UPI0019267EFC|nr:twin-arginine translocase TatA/TatE family subunit [Agreia sp. COWG]CAD6008870.1 Twin-arginine translocation protein TatB [Agreia sp. COWG]
MFGLTIEKLLVIAVIAAIIIGPQRLPHYAERLAAFVRALRSFAETAKTRVADELGPDFDRDEWKKLDPRQFDPRRIVQDALADPDAHPAAEALTPQAPPAVVPTVPAATTTASASASGGWQSALLSRIALEPAATPRDEPATAGAVPQPAVTQSGEG